MLLQITQTVFYHFTLPLSKQRNMFSPSWSNYFSSSAFLNYVIFLLLATQPSLLNCALLPARHLPPVELRVQCPPGYDHHYSSCEPILADRVYYLVCRESRSQSPLNPARPNPTSWGMSYGHVGKCDEGKVCVDIPDSPDRGGTGGAYCIAGPRAAPRSREISQQMKRKRPGTESGSNMEMESAR